MFCICWSPPISLVFFLSFGGARLHVARFWAKLLKQVFLEKKTQTLNVSLTFDKRFLFSSLFLLFVSCLFLYLPPRLALNPPFYFLRVRSKNSFSLKRDILACFPVSPFVSPYLFSLPLFTHTHTLSLSISLSLSLSFSPSSLFSLYFLLYFVMFFLLCFFVFLRKASDAFKFLRHVMRAILCGRPDCSHRYVSLKESPLNPAQILQYATRISTEQTSMRTKCLKHIAL